MPNTLQDIGYGGSALGGILGTVGQIIDQNAMSNQLAQQIALQNKLRNQGQSVFYNNLPNLGLPAAQQAMGKGASNRMSLYAAQPSFSALDPTARTSPTASTDAAALNQDAQARAKLGGYSDWELNTMINNIRANEKINQISDASRGWASIFPTQYAAASHAGDLASGIGSAIGSGAGAIGAAGNAQASNQAYNSILNAILARGMMPQTPLQLNYQPNNPYVSPGGGYIPVTDLGPQF